MSTEFANRVLEMRNPQQLLMVTKAHLDKYPDHRAVLSKYYDVRADRPVDTAFVKSVESVGFIHTPLFITNVEALGKEVVVAGRRRLMAAIALGFPEVPVIVHSDEDKLNSSLELTENFARSASNAVESAAAFRKAMAAGLTQEEIAVQCGITGAQVTYTLQLGDMPAVVHEWIAKGKLSETAALTLKKAVGKPAAKATGLTAIYDPKEVKTYLEGLEESARQAGGTKIKVKQAKNTTANPADSMTKKDWKAVAQNPEVAEDFATLILAVLGDISPAQARQQGLDFVRKAPPTPKKIKEPKEPKIKGEGKKKKEATDDNAVASNEVADVKSLFA